MTTIAHFTDRPTAPLAPLQPCACPASSEAQLMLDTDLRQFGYHYATMRGLAAFFRARVQP